MRVNIYAEEMSGRVEIISKEIDGSSFTGLRFYLELPVTMQDGRQVAGPFLHRPGDDDSSAVTFWGKRDLRLILRRALEKLDTHYGEASQEASRPPELPPFKVGDRVRWRHGGPHSTSVMTVTEITARGFKWKLDSPVCIHPLFGRRCHTSRTQGA